MIADDPKSDRESETEAILLAAFAGGVRPIEAFENMRQVFRFDTRAIITEGD